MRKKLVASGFILFTLGFLIALIPEQIEAHMDLSLHPMMGVMVGIDGIILVILCLSTMLTERL